MGFAENNMSIPEIVLNCEACDGRVPICNNVMKALCLIGLGLVVLLLEAEVRAYRLRQTQYNVEYYE